MSLGRRITAMKRSQHKTGTKAARAREAVKNVARQGRQSGDLEKALSLIRARPGIRPSEINRLMNRKESDGLRNMLIKRRLVRK
jgi:hypothetical protein